MMKQFRPWSFTKHVLEKWNVDEIQQNICNVQAALPPRTVYIKLFFIAPHISCSHNDPNHDFT